MRLIDKPVVELPVRVLDDHLKELLANRPLAQVGRIASAVLERVAQEYPADDRSQPGTFLAPDARLPFLAMPVAVDRAGPPPHEAPPLPPPPPSRNASTTRPPRPPTTPTH